MAFSWMFLFILSWHYPIGIDANNKFPDKEMLYGPGEFGTDTPQFILFTYSGNLSEKVSILMHIAQYTGCRKRSETLISRHLSKLTAHLLRRTVDTLAGFYNFTVNLTVKLTVHNQDTISKWLIQSS